MTTYLLRLLQAYLRGYSGVPLVCWERIAIYFLVDIATGVVFFLTLYFVRDLKFSIVIAGVIITAYGIGKIGGGFLGGYLADRFTLWKVSAAAIFVLAFSLLLLVFIKSEGLLIFDMLLLGSAFYTFTISNRLWIFQQCQDDKEMRLKSVNLLYTVMNLGVGLSAVLVSVLARFGFKNVFAAAAVLLFFCACYLLLVASKREGVVYQHAAVTANLEEQQPRQSNIRIISLVLISLFLIGMVVVQRQTTYSVFIHDTFPKLGLLGVGIVFALNPIMIVLLQVPIVNHVGRYNKLKVIGVGALLIGLGTWMLVLATSFWIAIVACMVYTLGEMFFMPIIQLVLFEQGSAKKKGQALSLFQITFASSLVVAPVLGAFVYHHFGANVLWEICGALGVLCCVACWRAKNF
jgi:MFS family permease